MSCVLGDWGYRDANSRSNVPGAGMLDCLIKYSFSLPKKDHKKNYREMTDISYNEMCVCVFSN
jgi:hypothetical protein